MNKKSLLWSLASLMVLASMIFTACAPQQPPTLSPEEAAGLPFGGQAPPPAGQELTDALTGKYKGTVVTMTGPFTDNDAVKFDASVKAFEDATGIDIQYTGSKEFEASIRVAVEGGSAPDVVDFPQPGLLASLAAEGRVVDLTDIVSADWLKENYIQSWLDMGTMEGANGPILAGVWGRANVKSIVFYPKKAFDEAGYAIPATWDEMMALTEQIASDGDTPWCVGIESGAATGWPLTDWVEDVMLRTTSLENYDAWVKGELKFDSPEVRNALKYITDIWFNDAYVFGGRQAIGTTAFGDAPKPMFDNPPKCWLHRQGDFIQTFFPEGLTPGVDYDFFYLPPIDESLGKPVLGGGDIYALFDDRPETRAVIQFFSTGESVRGWVEAGGTISPHNDSSLDWYKDPVTRKVAEVLKNATSFRFDGSDLMPGAVGAGSFWKSMTDYVSDSIDEDTALKQIDESWPK
jgi:alpha-glucoside transport system substrate-binding protein